MSKPPAAPSRPRVYIPLTLDRRTFVRGGGASVAAAALGRSASGQDIRDDDIPEDPVTHLADENFADVMDRPDQIPSPNSLQSLSPHEAETVDALTSRIMPGTPDDPGAHEAGVVTYIDALLAYNQGYAEFTYLQGPFAQTEASLASAAPATSGTPAATPGASPQASPVAGSEPKTIEVAATEYEYQPSSFTVRPGDTIRMTNNGTLQHDMAVEEWGDEAIIPLLDPGDSDEYTIPEDVETGTDGDLLLHGTGASRAGHGRHDVDRRRLRDPCSGWRHAGGNSRDTRRHPGHGRRKRARL